MKITKRQLRKLIRESIVEEQIDLSRYLDKLPGKIGNVAKEKLGDVLGDLSAVDQDELEDLPSKWKSVLFGTASRKWKKRSPDFAEDFLDDYDFIKDEMEGNREMFNQVGKAIQDFTNRISEILAGSGKMPKS